jgi:hypothetical protein
MSWFVLSAVNILLIQTLTVSASIIQLDLEIKLRVVTNNRSLIYKLFHLIDPKLFTTLMKTHLKKPLVLVATTSLDLLLRATSKIHLELKQQGF